MLDAPISFPVVRELSIVDVVARVERCTAVGLTAGVEEPLEGLLDLQASDCLLSYVLRINAHALMRHAVARLACD